MHLKQYATNFYYTHTWQQTKTYLPVTRIRSWHSSANVVTKLLIGWLGNHGLIPGRGKRTVSSLKRKDWDQGPPATYSMDSGSVFHHRGESADWPQLVPKMCAAMLSIPPTCLHGMERENHTLSQESYSNNVYEKYLLSCLITYNALTLWGKWMNGTHPVSIWGLGCFKENVSWNPEWTLI